MVSCLSSSSSIHPLLRVEFIYIENLSRSNSRISLLVCCLVSAVFFSWGGNEMERERKQRNWERHLGCCCCCLAATDRSIRLHQPFFYSLLLPIWRRRRKKRRRKEKQENTSPAVTKIREEESDLFPRSFFFFFFFLPPSPVLFSTTAAHMQYPSTDAVVFDSVTSVFNILKYAKLRHRTDRWIDKYLAPSWCNSRLTLTLLLRPAAAAAVAIEWRGWSDLRIIDRRCCNKALEHQSLLCSHAAFFFYIFLNICTKGLLKEEEAEGIVYVKYRRVIIVIIQGEQQQQQQQRQQREMEWNIVKPSENGASDEVRRRASSFTPRIL